MTRKKIDAVLLWLWIAAGLITIGTALIVMGMILGCAEPSFDVAALERDDSEGGRDAEVTPETTPDAMGDTGSAQFDSAPHESGEIDSAESGPDGDDGKDVLDDRGVDAAEAALDADTGCTLYSHYDPMSSTSFESCLPTGVPTDGSTYSAALLADEIAHAKSLTPWITWGAPSSIACEGASCVVYSQTVDAGIAYGTWCSSGPVAGWFIGTGVGGSPMCPTDLVHGEWR